MSALLQGGRNVPVLCFRVVGPYACVLYECLASFDFEIHGERQELFLLIDISEVLQE